jgi:hypothetical protein
MIFLLDTWNFVVRVETMWTNFMYGLFIIGLLLCAVFTAGKWLIQQIAGTGK